MPLHCVAARPKFLNIASFSFSNPVTYWLDSWKLKITILNDYFLFFCLLYVALWRWLVAIKAYMLLLAVQCCEILTDCCHLRACYRRDISLLDNQTEYPIASLLWMILPYSQTYCIEGWWWLPLERAHYCLPLSGYLETTVANMLNLVAKLFHLTPRPVKTKIIHIIFGLFNQRWFRHALLEILWNQYLLDKPVVVVIVGLEMD